MSVAVNVTSAQNSHGEITATCFKVVQCNCGHDDSSKAHLLRVWEHVGSGLKAVIVEYARVCSHMVFTDNSQSPQVYKCRALFRMEGVFVLSSHHRSAWAFILSHLDSPSSSFPSGVISRGKQFAMLKMLHATHQKELFC